MRIDIILWIGYMSFKILKNVRKKKLCEFASRSLLNALNVFLITSRLDILINVRIYIRGRFRKIPESI